MYSFNFFKGPDINAGVEQFEATPQAILLDVRTRPEYAEGRIPRSRNLPLDELSRAEEEIPNRSTPLFVYCLSGARSRQAAAMLQRMGYSSVTNIGGISGYRGEREG